MNKFDEPAEPRRCGARNRQNKMPCQDWAVPFGSKCRRHGGYTKAAQEKARKAMLDYEMFGSDPAWRKAERIRKWKIAARRYEMRQAKRKGPQAVAQLKAEWEFDRIEKRQVAEDNARARQQVRDDYKRRNQTPSTHDEGFNDGPGYIPYSGFDWDL